MRILGASLGNCVHVAGVIGFLRLAERLGHETEFLGAAVPVERVVQAIEDSKPDLVGLSYRLTPQVAGNLLGELRTALEARGLLATRMVFGGTPPVCEVARESGLFDAAFSGLEPEEEVVASLRGAPPSRTPEDYGTTQLERMERKAPYPLLRHHFGLPSLEATIEGARRIAEEKVVDVISIGPDQNAQESFFRPEEMDPSLDGAGGVPLRKPEDLTAIYQATRCGNYPLLRIYAGTRDLIKWAELSVRTIDNAWAAIPLCWYNALDQRSQRTPEASIAENQAAMRWYGERGIPVEVNEPHHWSLRDAHDAVAVAAAYLSAYNAKQLGVRHYIAQYMFNTPPTTYGATDLAKMLAKQELIEELQDDDFKVMRQVRAGLLCLSPDPHLAKGQLAASAALALGMTPHIIHVVGFCEGDHAATADDVIESCKIVRGVVHNCLFGMPRPTADPAVIERKDQLVGEARQIAQAIRGFAQPGVEDPLTDAKTLAAVIKAGLLDAPQLKGNPHAFGLTETRVLDGAVYAVDPETKRPLPEAERLKRLLPPGAAKALE